MPSAVAFLPLEHQRVHELGDELVLELRVRDDLALRYFAATGHGLIYSSSHAFGRLTPYFERLRLRLALLVERRAGGAGGVERAADDVVANAREVLHAAAADEHDRVLLEVVTLARDVGRDFHAVGQANAADLAERRVRLLRRRRVDANADATLLRAAT